MLKLWSTVLGPAAFWANRKACSHFQKGSDSNCKHSLMVIQAASVSFWQSQGELWCLTDMASGTANRKP